MVQKIEYNYNQIWHGIKANKIHICKFRVGDGSSTKFWHDPWSEGLPWENNFTELYNISNNKEASVAKLLSF